MSNYRYFNNINSRHSWSSVGRQQGGEKKKGCRQAAVGTQLPHGGLLTVIK